jgi:hypothetical protein
MLSGCRQLPEGIRGLAIRLRAKRYGGQEAASAHSGGDVGGM